MAAGALGLAACGGTATRSSPPVASAVTLEAWTRITAGPDGFLNQAETLFEYPPGAAVIVVAGDGRRYVRVHGETKAGSGHAVTADTAFYIASMTKAYVGLLAARLDAEHVLPLDTTLAAVWPGLQLPSRGRQARAVSLRDLLVHSIPGTERALSQRPAEHSPERSGRRQMEGLGVGARRRRACRVTA